PDGELRLGGGASARLSRPRCSRRSGRGSGSTPDPTRPGPPAVRGASARPAEVTLFCPPHSPPFQVSKSCLSTA
ncbi:unnamed protein product, partial [Rangifer tarandus platyrhynchus]